MESGWSRLFRSIYSLNNEKGNHTDSDVLLGNDFYEWLFKLR